MPFIHHVSLHVVLYYCELSTTLHRIVEHMGNLYILKQYLN